MSIDTSFLNSLARSLRKVVSIIDDSSTSLSAASLSDTFDFDKFLSTWFERSLKDVADPVETLEALKLEGPMIEAVREKGSAFLKTINLSSELPSAGKPFEDFAEQLGEAAKQALGKFGIVANLAAKYAISWSKYALKEDRWGEIGYLGPRGARFKPPNVVIDNNIAMTKVICTPDIASNTQYHRFFNTEYEKQMEKKNSLLRDNISDITNYPKNYEPDIVVIGTGPGGGAAAYALSQKAQGKKIVVLERGDLYTSEDFNQKERDMMPALYSGRGFRLTDEFSVAILQGNLVGGSAVLNHGICYKVPSPVTRYWKKKDDNDLPDISEQLEGGDYYEKVREMIHFKEIQKFSLNKNAQVLLRGIKKIKGDDADLHGVFEYHSRNTKAKIEPDGVPGDHYHELTCTGCGFCPMACRYDRKQTPLITFIPAAIKNGLNGINNNEVKVFKNAEVSSVLHDDGKVSGVMVKRRGLQPDLKITAKTVIVSTGAINTARLLMKSGIKNPYLGKKMSLHPSPLIYGVFEEDIYSDWGIPMAASYIENQFPEPGGVFEDGFGYILESIYSHPAMTALTFPLRSMRKRMKDYEKMASVAVIMHDKPVGEIKNVNSLFTALSYEIDEGDKKKLRHAIRTAAEIYLEAGAKEVFTNHEKEIVFRDKNDLKKADNCPLGPDDILLASAHPQGGCAMGSKGKGVVDFNGHSHDIENLYVSDASLYPTSLGVNPQLTTMAMGTKIGEYVAGRAEGLKK